MIDTDKYEGHTPGPWLFCIGYDIETDTYTGPSPLKGGGDRVNGPVILSEYQFERGTMGHKADLNLIQDAPRLLEAYKRLVIVADELYLHIVGEPHMTLDELVAEMPWREEE